MKVKELKERLNEYDDGIEVIINVGTEIADDIGEVSFDPEDNIVEIKGLKISDENYYKIQK